MPEKGNGLPKSSRQLKLPPDKPETIGVKETRRNRTTKVKLDLKSLNFTPSCEITGREGVSAVIRAQTQACKQRIANITCLSQRGQLYPESLKSSCPHSLGFVNKPKSLGCFKDDKTLKVLTGYYAAYKSENSPEFCAKMCLQSGYPYSGVEYSLVFKLFKYTIKLPIFHESKSKFVEFYLISSSSLSILGSL